MSRLFRPDEFDLRAKLLKTCGLLTSSRNFGFRTWLLYHEKADIPRTVPEVHAGTRTPNRPPAPQQRLPAQGDQQEGHEL